MLRLAYHQKSVRMGRTAELQTHYVRVKNKSMRALAQRRIALRLCLYMYECVLARVHECVCVCVCV